MRPPDLRGWCRSSRASLPLITGWAGSRWRGTIRRPRLINSEAALALDRRATAIYSALAIAYREAGKPELASARAEQRGDEEVGPPDPLMQEVADLLRSPVVYQRRGERALARNDFAGSVSEFRKGLELDPDSLSLRQKLGTSLWLAGDARERWRSLTSPPALAGLRTGSLQSWRGGPVQGRG